MTTRDQKRQVKFKLALLAGIFISAVYYTDVMKDGHAEQGNDDGGIPVSAESMADFCRDLPRPEYASLSRLNVDSDWFEVYRVAPGVTAIYEPHQWQEVISYLIEGEQRALLFDTGNGIGDIHALVEGLTDKTVVVLNSHSHYDHVGGNYAYQTIYGMDTDFTKLREAGRKNHEIAIEVSAQALCRPLPSGVTEKNHVGRPFRVSELIEDESVIDLGGRKLEVMHIPGHTPDAIALLDREARLLWTGDSYYSGPIWLFADETNLSDYANSLQKLVAEVENIDTLLPAHNTPWVDSSVLIDLQKDFHAMLAGKLKRTNQGDGMIEYQNEHEERPFTFLMRDEPLPYAE
ncbi:MAG: MBL fold metallo-hydrolase [Pseudomonadota bacterium]